MTLRRLNETFFLQLQMDLEDPFYWSKITKAFQNLDGFTPFMQYFINHVDNAALGTLIELLW